MDTEDRPATKAELDRLEQKIDGLSAETKALVEAWNTATGLVRFVKFLSTFIAALGAVYLFVKHGFSPPKAGG